MGRGIKKFEKFPKLPPEIRCDIWRMGGIVSRVVRAKQVNVDYGIYFKSIYHLSGGPVPKILHICQESRVEGLRHYSSIRSHAALNSDSEKYFNDKADYRIYINLKVDTIYFVNLAPAPAMLSWLRRVTKEEVTIKIDSIIIRNEERIKEIAEESTGSSAVAPKNVTTSASVRRSAKGKTAALVKRPVVETTIKYSGSSTVVSVIEPRIVTSHFDTTSLGTTSAVSVNEPNRETTPGRTSYSISIRTDNSVSSSETPKTVIHEEFRTLKTLKRIAISADEFIRLSKLSSRLDLFYGIATQLPNLEVITIVFDNSSFSSCDVPHQYSFKPVTGFRYGVPEDILRDCAAKGITPYESRTDLVGKVLKNFWQESSKWGKQKPPNDTQSTLAQTYREYRASEKGKREWKAPELAVARLAKDSKKHIKGQ